MDKVLWLGGQRLLSAHFDVLGLENMRVPEVHVWYVRTNGSNDYRFVSVDHTAESDAKIAYQELIEGNCFEPVFLFGQKVGGI